MTPEKLLELLREHGAKIWIENDKLRIHAPKALLTPELKTQLAAQKPALIKLLQTEAAAEEINPPLSLAQERFWFLDKMEPGNPTHNINIAYRLMGRLDVQALQNSLSAIVARHETLRTTIRIRDERPYQHISENRSVALPLVALNDDSELQAHLLECIKQPFDLETGPLFRCKLFRLQEDNHVLWIGMHHIISDGWSLSVFCQELSAFYGHFAGQNTAPRLPALPQQYRHFAAAQRRSIAEPDFPEKLNFWLEKLKSVPAQTELFPDAPRPGEQRYIGAAYEFAFPPELSELVARAVQTYKVSPFVLLVSAFAALVYRYTGQSDIVLGSPNANRTKREWEPLIGCFINPMALRMQISPTASFEELLRHVQEVVLEAHAHGDIPFDQIIQSLHLQRDLSRNPIFQMLFQVFTPTPLSLPNLSVTPVSIASQFTEMDLQFFVSEEAGSFSGKIIYSTDLFAEGTIAQLAEHFLNFTRSALQLPRQAIGQLSLLSADDFQRQIFEWNRTRADFPAEQTIAELVREQARQTPEKTAVIFQENRLSYAELSRRGNQFAHYFVDKGIKPGDVVGICLYRQLDLLPCLLGIIQTGAAYVPMDPVYPAERLRYMMSDAGIQMVIAEDATANLFTDTDGEVIKLSHIQTALATFPDTPLPQSHDPERLMYMLYTSGSTGKPKGVQVCHRNVMNLLTSVQKQPGITKDDRLLSITSLSFDISVLELYLPIISGATLVLIDESLAVDPRLLAEQLEAHQITFFQATPATWRMLVDAGWENRTVRTAITGGEALAADLAKKLLDRGLTLWNMYGPTETTIYSTLEKILPDTHITIGKPLQNTRAFIVDANFQPVPVGVPGELVISGAGVSKGYRNLPEMTAERFVPLPPALQDPAFGKWQIAYRTGDLARFLPDGRIDYLGRIDNQVKLRGFRIELGEVESLLREVEGVSEAVAAVKEIAPGDERLIAYVTESQDGVFQQRKARKYLRTKLPTYMIPGSFIVLDKLPLTPSGKVDRKALPMPQTGAHTAAKKLPSTEMEKALAEIWQELIGIDTVYLQDNFFDVGGHSLLAMQMILKVESRLGCRITPRDVLLQNLGQLAAYCAAQTEQQSINN
jgi:amino acid adenylation domain-containing protein